MKRPLDDSLEHRQRVAKLLDAALDSGALAFAAPLLRGEAAAPNGTARIPEPIATSVRQMPRHPPDSESTQASLPKDTGGPYVLERKLARGGMATVYLARDVKHDRSVAVKVLDAELTARLGAQRFVKEIRLTARLQHPHVLGLLDSGVFGPEAGTFAGRPYYVMPYVEGESVRARLARGRLPVSEAIRVLREVADALRYAHEQGVVHRDIKPENILLSREHAVVADFGIAKALVASRHEPPNDDGHSTPPDVAITQFSTRVGTPAYMAPEQAIPGASLDHRADLYAWGVVAYELLAGRHPFDRSTSAHDLLAAHASEVPAPIQQITPDVPAGVAELVMHCLAKRPADRPASAAEILNALDASTSGRRSTLFALSTRRLATVLALLMLISAVLAGNAYRRRQPVLIIGTGDAARDVPAVQDAVNGGGDITLQGHFNFALPPTKPVAALLASGWYPPAAEILISKAVNISGVRDARGEMATIESGTIPFYIDAPGDSVRIRGLRFVRSISAAILVRAVHGLEIRLSKIEALVPFPRLAEGIAINTAGGMPMPTSPGNPKEVFGKILIANNEIDGTGGTADSMTGGIRVYSVGQAPDRVADVDIIGNRVSNVSTSAINIRRVAGRVRILGNTIRTSTATRGNVDCVRLVSASSFLMAENTVECRWPNAPAIQVFSPFPEWPTERAIVEDNTVIMSPAPGAALGEYSAGISIRGFAKGDTVRHNTISGRALFALSMYEFRGGVPADNAFIDNRLEGFEATSADILVGSGVVRAQIIGPGSVTDHGSGTVLKR